jgi:hypothetical protein
MVFENFFEECEWKIQSGLLALLLHGVVTTRGSNSAGAEQHFWPVALPWEGVALTL